MTQAPDPRFFALLVHQKLLTAETVRQALASGADPVAWLTRNAGVSRQQWDEWVATDAGTRPQLKRYELFEMLGQGGTARVFRARDRTNGDVVALKVLRPELGKDPAAVAKFVHEARLLCELRSEHIVRGLRVAREGAVVYAAMELVPGRSLQDVVADGSLAEDDALRIVAQVAAALSVLHARGLVHRDVKPGNILWTDDGRAVLIDLGFATDGAGAGDTTAGTAAYIAPEQARGAGLDVRADIYALGATLYHLVVGSLPFEGRTSEETMAKQVLEALSGAAIRARGLSPQTHWFIEKMMAKEKELRFQSPDELRQAVESRLAQTQREHTPEAAARKRRRRNWL